MTANPQSAAEALLHLEFLKRHPIESGNLLEKMPVSQALGLLEPLEAEVLAPVYESLSPASAETMLGELPAERAVAILNHMAPTRVAMLIRALASERRQALVDALEPKVRSDVQLLLDCDPDTAGAIMDPRVLFLHRDMQVAEALGMLRAQRIKFRHASARRIMLIVDKQGRPEGIVAIQDLALADPKDPVQRYMLPVPAAVPLTAPKAEIVRQMEEHRVSSLPVVDSEGHLVGLVRHDELVAAAREDAVADIQKMFGASPQEQALSPPWFTIKRRLLWLQINLGTAFLAAAVVGVFEGTIAQFTALAVLLPVVAGQSGNTGAQALAVAMRGLALKEISVRHWPRLLRKEFLVGLANGIAIAVTVAVGVYFWSGSAGLTLVIAIAMVLSMIIAGLAGAAIPVILTRLGQDPAQSSSIILTTVTDVAGFFSFLGIATLFITML